MIASPLKPLLHDLKQECWVVTPNKHLTHVLMQQFTQEFEETVQLKPQYLPYKTLVRLCYNHLMQESPTRNHPSLLTDIQALYIWQAIGHDLTKNSINNYQTVPYSTWQLSKIWSIDFDKTLFNATTNTELFYKLAHTFERTLHDLHSITDEMAIPYFIQHTYKLPFIKIIFACFDDYTPQQKLLINFFISCNATVEHFDLQSNSTPIKQFVAPTAQIELLAFTNWAEKLKDKAPIALIVPNMENQYQSIKNWLKIKFPSLEIYFSLGKSLASYPLVQHAMVLLLLLDTSFILSKAKLILNSPFISGFTHERTERIKLAATHPLLQSSLITFEQFLKVLNDNSPCSQQLNLQRSTLATRLQHLTPYPNTASAYEWEQIFIKRLIECGFPGEFAFTSETSQVYQRFIKLLQSFKELHVVTTTISKNVALKFLIDMLKNCLFQPKQNIKAPIHVLGLLEAAGSNYSAIWIMDLNEQNFPAILKPTPFIPLKLQQQFSLPHTSLENERMLNIKRLERIQNSCDELIVSYTAQAEDGLQKPSFLIAPYQEIQFDTFTKQHINIMENYQDPKFIDFATDEVFPHNSIVLTEQAKCPFRAFATSRLKTGNLTSINNGLTAQHRGIILHKTLEYFWHNVKTQTKLKALDNRTILKLITNCTYKAMHSVSATFFLSKFLKTIEVKRIRHLILATLEWEKTRPYFEISALEAKTHIAIGPLNLQIRLDRLDKINSNKYWIIDYKTSIPKPLPWQQDRPQEIQILLYALAFPNIRTLLFHGLNKGKASMKGLTAHSEFCTPDLKQEENWEVQLVQWKNYLIELAENFSSGNCEAKPIDQYICKTCKHKNLCRTNI